MLIWLFLVEKVIVEIATRLGPIWVVPNSNASSSWWRRTPTAKCEYRFTPQSSFNCTSASSDATKLYLNQKMRTPSKPQRAKSFFRHFYQPSERKEIWKSAENRNCLIRSVFKLAEIFQCRRGEQIIRQVTFMAIGDDRELWYHSVWRVLYLHNHIFYWYKKYS